MDKEIELEVMIKTLQNIIICTAKYLQVNPPTTVEFPEELKACSGAGSYENGWKQWYRFLIKLGLDQEMFDRTIEYYKKFLNMEV